MNGKTILLLGLAVLGGMLLGAVGMQYVGSWEGAAQALGVLRQSGSPPPGTTLAAVRQPADRAAHDTHEGHTHAAHRADEPGPDATAGVAPAQADTQRPTPPPAVARGARPHSADAHGHADEKMVRFPAAKAQQLGIEVAVARAGRLQTSLTLPGTVMLNAERRVHVVSRIPGIVQEIRKQLGDTVRAGETMAVIDSRELADTKAAYLASRERVALAETIFAREKDLWEKKISPQEDYLKAKQALTEVRIELQVAAQKLRALGFAEASVQQLAGRVNASLTRYEVAAPFAGTVIERHLAIGEVLKDDTEAFVVADLSTVWVDLHLSTKDLALVRKGQRVVIATHATMQAEGTVSYISPVVSDETRTVLTRVVLPNPDGRWRPGLFVTARLTAGETPVAVLIPKTATQTIDGQPSVFVQTLEGFALRPVTLGRANESHVEVTAGLETGERYATTETFLLKAELGKGAASHEH
ncbi:MAG: efflux RND transporter periplasmic adaptor subunit [Candidatus Tectimicrobiota bacterium]